MDKIISSLNLSSILNYSIGLIIILGSQIIGPIISYIVIFLFHKILKVERKPQYSGFYEPLKFMLIVSGFGVAIYYLEMPTGVVNLYWKIFKILAILSIAKALSNSLKPDSTFFNKLENNTNFNGNEALNSFLGNVLRIIIYIFAAYVILIEFNYDLGGLITGLGLGSAVIALAAQDFVKSLIGGFAIIADRPFEIGDYIEVGEFQGTVTEITFRSTRIKAVNNTIISMPNSVVVTAYVKNWSKLESRRFDMDLRLDLNLNTENINRCISKIKTVLKANSEVLDETIMVNLSSIESDANIVKIICYVKTTEYAKYIGLKQQINCDILDVLERENIELVYPTQTIYTKTK